MKKSFFCFSFFIFTGLFSGTAQNKPNIVLIFPDNLGIGEVNSYGSVRGVPTPNIDKMVRKESGLPISMLNLLVYPPELLY